MSFQHQELKKGRWFQFLLISQLSYIGSEAERPLNWRKKADLKCSELAFFRPLELLSLTLADPKNKTSLKELTRLYELLGDYFAGDNFYQADEGFWKRYFYPFYYASRIKGF